MISIEHRRNDHDRMKQKYTKKTLPKWHFIGNKSHIDIKGSNPALEDGI
jgi:hypothetical protein